MQLQACCCHGRGCAHVQGFHACGQLGNDSVHLQHSNLQLSAAERHCGRAGADKRLNVTEDLRPSSNAITRCEPAGTRGRGSG